MLHPRPSPAAVVIRQEDPVQPDVVALTRHGEAFSAASILQKAITIFRWMRSESPRFVSWWPVTRKGTPLLLALSFSTTVGLRLNECGLKRLRGAEE
jgi:hypothetical protein